MDWDLRGPDSNWVYAGRWVTHPPLEVVEQLVGRQAIDACVQRFREDTDAWACLLRLGDCFTVQLFASGNVQLDLRAKSCGGLPAEVEMQVTGFEEYREKVGVPIRSAM